MNDEVSVTELLEREGWGELNRKPNGRMRLVAVMLAVVLGCGLAALLVHIGSESSQADSPSLFNLPHGPTGGLAGGGVPSSPTGSEVTDTSATVVVTNERPVVGGGINGLPGHKQTRDTDTQTVTVTDSADPRQDTSTPPVSTTSTPPRDGVPSSKPGTTTAQPQPSCVLVILCW